MNSNFGKGFLYNNAYILSVLANSRSLVVKWLAHCAGGLPFKSGILPLLKHASWEQWPTTMLAVKRSAGVTPEVNLNECTSHMPLPSVNMAARNRGISGPIKKNMCLQNILKCFGQIRRFSLKHFQRAKTIFGHVSSIGFFSHCTTAKISPYLVFFGTLSQNM